MRKSKFIESQIVGILGEGQAGMSVAKVYRKMVISVSTCITPAVSAHDKLLKHMPRQGCSF